MTRTDARFHSPYDQFPEQLRIALQLYVDEHRAPGNFLTAVICNDLKEAVARADEVNAKLLREYVRWFYNEAPAQCWGSKENFQNWIKQGDQK
jgi:hypothetical protein